MRRAECRRATRPSFITGWSALLLLLLLLLVSSTGTISCERHAVVVWLPPQRSRVLRPAVLVAVDCRTAIVSRDSVAIYFPDGGSGAVPICTPLLNARSSSLRTSTSSCLASASTDNYVTNRGMLNTSRITQYEDFFLWLCGTLKDFLRRSMTAMALSARVNVFVSSSKTSNLVIKEPRSCHDVQ